jgi:hypothetical protein
MHVYYNDIIDKFQEMLGTQKDLIEDTFNKPDLTDVIIDKYISIKNFGDYYILIIFDMDERAKSARILYAYRIYQKMLDGTDISKMKPLEVLTEFMNRYGISKEVPGFGQQKIIIKKAPKVFFPGILDVEKYLEAVKNISGR